MTEDNPVSKIHPFWEGQYARETGKVEYDNPYRKGSRDFSAWQHGWDEMEESTHGSA